MGDEIFTGVSSSVPSQVERYRHTMSIYRHMKMMGGKTMWDWRIAEASVGLEIDPEWAFACYSGISSV